MDDDAHKSLRNRYEMLTGSYFGQLEYIQTEKSIVGGREFFPKFFGALILSGLLGGHEKITNKEI